MQQLTLFQDTKIQKDLARHRFSHNGVCHETARFALEERYAHLLEETDKFNRQLVSFQANKTEVLHSWIKYREGFSANLIELLIKELGISPGDVILDPFAGSATTLLTAKMLGLDAVGIELLPHCHLAWEAKSKAFDYDLAELRHVRFLLEQTTPPKTNEAFPHLTITETAFPPQIEKEVMAYTRWFETLTVSQNTKTLCKLILMSLLEEVSYTRKDGQYLRWDSRADKIRGNNEKRLAQGKKPIQGIDKGTLPSLKRIILEKLNTIIIDIAKLQRDPPPPSSQKLIAGNTLYTLPPMEPNQFAAVITSPPYANRYDYTRTYALELAYLQVDNKIFDLRQNQLSCTVENKSKENELKTFYQSLGQEGRYQHILEIIQSNQALAEINEALLARHKREEVNNRGILTMIDQYFTELAFVFAELFRVCRSGARVVFVNDNVRYAGEVVPVDMLSTDLAEQVGFTPAKIYVLPQRKGNSSQQMGKFGREALRKSITIWIKP
ncbi:MAG: modification methylase [Anaerolineae bacterium]|nr:modification methylase [Anaerolineae bacterium]